MRNRLISVFSLLLLAVTAAAAQDQTVQNASNIGMPPNGIFSGSDFESVQLQNGNLHIDIPIWSYKGRGLGTGSKFIYDSMGWTSTPPHCDHMTGECSNSIIPMPGNNLSLAAHSSFGYSAGQGIPHAGPGTCSQYMQYTNYTLRGPDGTKHHFLPDPAYQGGSTGAACGGPLGKMYADDGSGWVLNVQPSYPGTPISAISKDGTKVTLTSGVAALIEDSNGNYLNASNSTDTLGRTVYGANYVDSNGTQQPITITTQAVTIQTNLCQFLGQTTCFEYSSTWNLPHIITLPNGMTYTISYVQGQYGQPSSMTLPTGGQISWTWYQPSGNTSTMGPMVQSRSLTANGQTGTWQYSNESSPRTTPATVTDPAGNQTVTAFTCPTGRYVDENMNSSETDPPCYVSSVKYYQGSSLSGTLLKTVATTYTPSGAMLPQTVTTTLNDANLVSKTVTTYDSIAIPLWTSDQFTWGNPTEVDDYDWGTGAAGALLRKQTTSYLHQSNSTYQTANIADKPTLEQTYDGSGNIIAKSQFFYDDPGGYMLPDLGSPPNHDAAYSTSYLIRGNATRVQHWLNPGNTWLTTNNYYDDLGNLRQTYDPGNHLTTYSYTDNFTVSAPSCVPAGYKAQAFASVVTNALSQISATGYFGCTGLPAWKQDQNDINGSRYGSQFTYDLMNRPLTATYADGGQSTYCYGDPTGPCASGLYYVNRNELICNSSTSASCPGGQTLQAQSWTEFDGLGRTYRTAKVNGEASPNIYDQVDTCYDSLGHKSFERSPYEGAGWGTNPACANSTSTPGDAFLYDALERPTQITNTDGSKVTTSYWGNWTTVTDQAGRSRKSKTDALGRLVEVCEPDPATGTLPTQGTCTYETDYQYDALGDLTRVDQKGAQTDSTQWRTRLFTYDSLGRLLTANNPETGTISYTYNPDSLMASKTAPNVNGGTGTITTNYGYDAVHRLTAKSYSNTSNSIGYYYDLSTAWGQTISNPIGRLVLTNSYVANPPPGSTGNNEGTLTSYDFMGRPTLQIHSDQRASNVPGQTFTYSYNLDGSLNTEQYPSLRTITYAYNVGQRALSAVDTADAINYVTSAHYTAWGALASAVYGNTPTFAGITLTDQYNSRMQPAFITASTPANTVLNLGYEFHLGNGATGSDNGNVWQITNNLTSGRTQTFTYDYLNRILTGQSSATSGPSCWGESFGYDMWANLTIRNVSKCSAEGPVPAATIANRMSTYSYDLAGNMLTGSYTYDAENRLLTAPGLSFDYDADGKRVQKSSGTLYWYGANDETLAETDLTGALKNEYIFFNGERAARRDSSGNVFYYFEDHLGSSRIITNASGSPCYDADFYPFGGEQSTYLNTCPQNYKFTGKERDSETGLDEFGARYYSNALGRFTTPDWAAKPTAVPYAKFGDPQTLNLYSYVENAPVNKADADGHGFDSPLEQDPEHMERNFGASANQFRANAQAFLSVASFVPGPIGRAAAVTNAAISFLRGDVKGGVANAAAAIPIGGKLSKAELMLKNAATGKAAEKVVEQTLAKEGAAVVGKQVSVRTSIGLRRVDFLTKSAEGQLTNIEAKSANAERTAAQVAKDNEIATQGGTYVGKNAPDGVQGTKLTVPTEIKRPN